jgi:hypothetical protein
VYRIDDSFSLVKKRLKMKRHDRGCIVPIFSLERRIFATQHALARTLSDVRADCVWLAQKVSFGPR